MILTYHYARVDFVWARYSSCFDLVFPPIELVNDLHVSMSFDQLLHIFSEGIDGR